MYGIIGEDRSDVETLKILVRRIANNDRLPVHGKGYDGCAQLLRKGASQISLFSQPPLGYQRFIVCYDCDNKNPDDRYKEVMEKIVYPCEVNGKFCVTIPVQELEAWILADIKAVSNVFTGWVPADVDNPEGINNPKEYLEKLSRAANKKPRYSHATHNPKVANYLDINLVASKCRSFIPLLKFIREGIPNAFNRPQGV